MNNISVYKLKNPAISNADICNVILKAGLLDRNKMAENGDRQPHTIWNWLNNRSNFPAFGIPMYINSTGDTSPLDLICKACGYIAVPQIDAEIIDENLRKVEALISIDNGEFIKEVERDISPESEGGEKLVKREVERILTKGTRYIRKIRALMLLAQKQVRF